MVTRYATSGETDRSAVIVALCLLLALVLGCVGLALGM